MKCRIRSCNVTPPWTTNLQNASPRHTKSQRPGSCSTPCPSQCNCGAMSSNSCCRSQSKNSHINEGCVPCGAGNSVISSIDPKQFKFEIMMQGPNPCTVPRTYKLWPTPPDQWDVPKTFKLWPKRYRQRSNRPRCTLRQPKAKVADETTDSEEAEEIKSDPEFLAPPLWTIRMPSWTVPKPFRCRFSGSKTE